MRLNFDSHNCYICGSDFTYLERMFFLVFVSIIGLTCGQTIPHGHDLKAMVDKVFERLDHSPTDGRVSEAEWDIIINQDDVNNDSCVSYAEYTATHPIISLEVSDKMFHHFDHDKDNCLKLADMQAEYKMIDHNHDSSITLHEWEQYFTHLLTQLFGHGNPVNVG